MKKEKILRWRLSEKPSVDSLATLTDRGIITKEEARQILLEENEVGVSEFEDIKKEVEFLRTLVLEISSRPSVAPQIIKIIEKEYQKPYWYDVQPSWTQPYVTMCSNGSQLAVSGSGAAVLSQVSSIKDL